MNRVIGARFFRWRLDRRGKGYSCLPVTAPRIAEPAGDLFHSQTRLVSQLLLLFPGGLGIIPVQLQPFPHLVCGASRMIGARLGR